MRTVKPFSLFCALLCVGPVFAQAKKSVGTAPAPTGQRRNLQAELEKELKLTEAQKKKWTEIIGRYRPKVKAVQDKYAPKLDELRKQMRTLSTKASGELKPTLDARRTELDAVLTPEQRKKKATLDAALKAAIQRRAGSGNQKT
ncbi:MAG: Spy/CpxP family protein refolding chaperone [Armatimonadetes bacterium]|nr:Spy/CpxP family protein refolding chaperone [Armatimonadota bacterium]